MIPEKVLQAYSCDPKDATIEPISIGLIHQTYKVIFENTAYIFQSLNPLLASPEIAQDMDRVTKHVASKGVSTPIIVRNSKDKLLTDFENTIWRVQTCIAGESHEIVLDKNMALELGKQLGVFHSTLSDLEYEFQSTRKNHPTHMYLGNFKKVVLSAEQEMSFVITQEISYIQERVEDLLLPSDLKESVIHGDPKISNFLFRDGKAHTTVDLDTCGKASVLFDLGDAFRSWCGGLEDDLDNSFNINHFTFGLQGYIYENQISKQEVSLIPQSIELITLELAMRFCTDYIEDSYFGYDKERYSNRRAHNLARTRGQIALHKSIVAQREQIEEVIKSFL